MTIFNLFSYWYSQTKCSHMNACEIFMRPIGSSRVHGNFRGRVPMLHLTIATRELLVVTFLCAEKQHLNLHANIALSQCFCRPSGSL